MLKAQMEGAGAVHNSTTRGSEGGEGGLALDVFFGIISNLAKA